MTVRIASFVVATCLIAWVFGLSAAERPGSKTHTVTVDGMRFQPDDLTVASGDTIVWVNKDLVAHTATSESWRLRLEDHSAGEGMEAHHQEEGRVPLRLPFSIRP